MGSQVGILLIRHGDTQARTPENWSAEMDQPNPDLSDRGVRQAELLGRRLAGSGIRRIYASDLRRALRTAEIVNGALGVPVEVRPGLREIDMGRLKRCSWEDIRREDPEFHDRWHRHEEDLRYPDGETGAEAAARAMAVIREAVGSGLDKVAVVCHGGTVRVLLCEALGIGQEKRFLFGPPENTSVSVLIYDRETEKFSVERVNDWGHCCSE